MKYTICQYNDNIKYMIDDFPVLEKYFDSFILDNNFKIEFFNAIYDNVEFLNNLIFLKLKNRKGYHKEGRIHIFENELTHSISKLEVKKYKICIESDDKSNIFFDILYHNLKSYVIINENL